MKLKLYPKLHCRSEFTLADMAYNRILRYKNKKMQVMLLKKVIKNGGYK